MNSMLRLVMVLTLITAGAGLILSMVEAVTREPIAEQRRLETLRAIQAVLTPADNSPDQDFVQLVTMPVSTVKNYSLRAIFLQGTGKDDS